MILDNQTLLSNAQAITGDAGSTNQIDLGPIRPGIVRDIGNGKPIPILIQVTEAFAAAGAATMTVALQADDNPSFTSPKTVGSVSGVPVADMKPGKAITIDYVPRGTNERYIRLNYTVITGPFTAGRITAGILLGGHQTNG